MEQYNDDNYQNGQNRYNAQNSQNNMGNQASPNYGNEVQYTNTQYEQDSYNGHNNNVIQPNATDTNYTNDGYNNMQSDAYPPNNMQPTPHEQSTHQNSLNNNTDSYNQPMNTSTVYGNNTYGINGKTTNVEKSNKNEQFLLFSLIIAISITAIVIGVGWTLFYPKPISEQVENLNNADTSLAELQNNGELDSQDLVIIYGADNDDISDNDNNAVVENNTNTNTTNVAKTTNKATDTTVKKTKTVSSTQVKTTTQTPTKPQSMSSIATDTKYWIQIFSTNNRDKANKIQTDLDTQGIKAIIITKNINNSIFYRLRIGPYYNQDEGRKFLEWIRRNNKYQDAYISVEKG